MKVLNFLSSINTLVYFLVLDLVVFNLCYAFDINKDNNFVNYWGQNSFGASGGNAQFWQKPLEDYCQSTEGENVIVLAFLHVFNSGTRDLPRMDLSNQCNPNNVFPGTSLLHCPQTGSGVKLCQSKGKAILLSLGGAAGSYGFSNDGEAKDFAKMIWNLFLGGTSATRPLGDAVLDGVDLDIEGGSQIGYPAFVTELRALFATDPSKRYYISAAPQCPFPDAYLGQTLQSAWIDMVFVQFYNNYCGTQAYGTFNFNFEQWDNWAKTTSVNRNVKIFLGVPASRTAANAGYVSPNKLHEIVDSLRCKYNSFGGVMMWDISQSYANFDSASQPFSSITSTNLKRSRQELCGGAQLPPPPPPPPHVQPVDTPNPVISVAPAPAPTIVEQPPSVVIPQKSACPVTGGKCQSPPPGSDFVCDGYKFAVCPNGQWILQDCAPGTYCTPHGCDFITGPVKSCLEMEQLLHAGSMKAQMLEAVDRMWNKFGMAMDNSWSDYLGIDHDTFKERPNDLDQQHAFSIPDNNKDEQRNANAEDDAEPFLIDFTQLDASPENFKAQSNPVDGTTSFRTQVRIRTNRETISPLWWISFYVKPGQVVHGTSRGTIRQKGLEVLVASDPIQEAEQNMVIRFVIEGIKRSIPSRDEDSESDPEMRGGTGIFEAESLPDAASARFETLSY
ncbi:Chitinase 1 [Entomortierella beljakovae]|nr:Chitinase 1 [Entomortierella beljakovae]